MFSITILPVSIKASTIAFLILAIFSTGCDGQVREATLPTATPLHLTATLPATPPRAASETPLPPPPQPTVAPVEGVTSTQINVRAEPSTAGNVLGMIPANTKVEIVGKDPGGNWWQINYAHAQAADGKGWVTAQYVKTAAKPDVPIIGDDQANPNSGNVAVVQQQINVRSGPGTDFNSLGTLNPQDVVNLLGKDSNGVWLQVEFAAGPEGKGWVNAAFVRAQGVENLPIVAETGLVVGTGTPTAIPLTPTATIVPAWADHDSPQAPIVSVVFEPAGTQTLIYAGDVSAPQGDPEDWIAFKPYGPFVFISLECQGSNSLNIDLTENSLPVSTQIHCGAPTKKMTVNDGANYLVHLQAVPSTTGELQYTHYVLTVKMRP